MRIAVISDTHGRLPEKILPSLAAADEIWHLGDFCNLSTLSACIGIGRPFYAVLGNNDFGLDLPLTLDLVRCGRTFHLIHILPRRLPAADFLLFGHTHVPRDEQVESCRLLNPGTIGKPNKGAPPSWAWLEISENGEVSWKMNPV
ncbi:MAG: metallophosphoesterase family protein [Spartobacteria bacterium]